MANTAQVCVECGHRSIKWLGRCPACSAWDSLAPEPPASTRSPPPVPIAQVDPSRRPRLASGIGELDRVLGGGLAAGSVLLLAGEPGVGKSTLMLQAAGGFERAGLRVLFVCAEESLEQVAARAARLGGLRSTRASSAPDLPTVLEHVDGSDVAIIDSIQALFDPGLSGEPGSVGQVRACASALGRLARQSGAAVVLVGHVTKDGSVAGPRALEHLVDAVLTFEGDRGHALRCVRAVKNRFGPAAEVGVFEMGPSGLLEVLDASGLFLADRNTGVAGSAVGCILEGRRPVALEIQTLVVTTRAVLPRRVANGIDPARLGVAVAVLERRAGVGLAGFDVYASVAGGFRAGEPGIDLALALSLASTRWNRPVPADLAAVGEVGLAGEIRAVPGTAVRLNEVARLGFRRALVPASHRETSEIETIKVDTLSSALRVLR